jgi:hypothetical protein
MNMRQPISTLMVEGIRRRTAENTSYLVAAVAEKVRYVPQLQKAKDKGQIWYQNMEMDFHENKALIEELRAENGLLDQRLALLQGKPADSGGN